MKWYADEETDVHGQNAPEAALQAVVREVADEWMAAGRLHVSPDDTSGDDDLGFWAEVDRRLR